MKDDIYSKVNSEEKRKGRRDFWLKLIVILLVIALAVFVIFLLTFLPLSKFNNYWLW